MVRVSEDQFFHLRGRHVQHSHARDTGKEEYSGAMVALLPSEEDARRIHFSGGESQDQLHLTLFDLGEASKISARQQDVITNQIMDSVGSLGPVSAHVFGVSHWNGQGDRPCWVLTVGDDPKSGLSMSQLRSHIDLQNLPDQPSPWAPHICMAYTGDLSLAAELQKRLGPIEFDRVRVAFAGSYTDIPLSGTVTASGEFRRNLTDTELKSKTDFARMQKDWEDVVEETLKGFDRIRAKQKKELVDQVLSAAQRDDLDALSSLKVSEETISSTEKLLFKHLVQAAEQAGKEQQRSAEDQGVTVPEWSLDSLTAAAGRDLLRSVSSVTSRILSSSFVQSAVRRALSLVGRPQVTPEQVAEDIDTHLSELSDAGPKDVIGGAVTTAQGEGRRIVMSVAPPAAYYESSEILDKSACSPCREQDGTRYKTLADASEAYPSGGYKGCLGGPRCRGTIVPVWEE